MKSSSVGRLIVLLNLGFAIATACKVEPAPPTPTGGSEPTAEGGEHRGNTNEGKHTSGDAGDRARGGAANDPDDGDEMDGGDGGGDGESKASGGRSPDESGATAGEGGRSGGAGATGAAGAGGDGDREQEVCELGESCSASCREPNTFCAVRDLRFTCEFLELAGQGKDVACGETAVVGQSCCGGCGCIDVEVYFDGRTCWQGIPDCHFDSVSGKMFH